MEDEEETEAVDAETDAGAVRLLWMLTVAAALVVVSGVDCVAGGGNREGGSSEVGGRLLSIDTGSAALDIASTGVRRMRGWRGSGSSGVVVALAV